MISQLQTPHQVETNLSMLGKLLDYNIQLENSYKEEDENFIKVLDRSDDIIREMLSEKAVTFEGIRTKLKAFKWAIGGYKYSIDDKEVEQQLAASILNDLIEVGL